MAGRTRRTKLADDTGEAQTITTPIDEVAQEPPPSETVLPKVKQRNKKNLFNTELILEAAKPQYNAKTYDELIALCGYDGELGDAALRTRISQLVNAKHLDEKFRPPVKGKAKK